MKQIILFIGLTTTINVSLHAQGTHLTADRYHTLTTSFLPSDNNDEQEVRSIVTTLETGWNNKSGAVFSSVFDDVHDYIVVNGMYFSKWTKKGNEAAHQNLFDGVYKNYSIKLIVDKITFLRPDLAQIIVIGAGYDKGSALPENPNTIMTILTEKKNDTWKIISFHNHHLDDNIKERSPMPLNIMYASWYKK